MAADGARTWIQTGSPENHAATAAHGYAVIGCKERRRNQAHPRRFATAPELAFQGQLRTLSEADAALLMDRLHAAAGVIA